MRPPLLFHAGDEDRLKRLDVFLARRETSLSRSQIKKLIEEGLVLVGGKKAKAGLRLKTGEEVSLSVPEAKKADISAEPLPLSVLYEDAHLVVIDKPAGWVVHPGAGNPSGTLVNALLHHCRDLGGIGGVLRPGIVHRLDKDTSGVLVAAKNDAAHRGLAEQFKNRSPARIYLGIVFGQLAETGEVAAPIGRHPVHRQKMSARPRKGRRARTRWRVLERFQGFCLAEFRLDTGRTHQIRVHLSSIGHPLLGDPVYGGRRGIANVEPPPLREGLQKFPRQALHAATLGFIHPVGGACLEFSSPLPDDLEEVLALLRKWS
jgi:23S rRNA pseudouridine1911/1915/1917 synthase